MHRLLWVLLLTGLPGLNDGGCEENFDGGLDNEIPDNQQEGETAPCQPPEEFSGLDKVLVTLENSRMREKILLESLGHCCKGALSFPMPLEKRVVGSCQHCVSSLMAEFKAQMDEVRFGIEHRVMELKDWEAERERILNSTLQQLPAPTQRPGGSGSGRETQAVTSDLMEQEVTSSPDKVSIKKALDVLAADLLEVQLKLSGIIEQLGQSSEDQGQT